MCISIGLTHILSQNFIDDVINEDKARMQLLDLCETLNDYERGVVRAIVGL